MTHKQMVWASKHDWFVSKSANLVTGEYTAYVMEVMYNSETGVSTEKRAVFTDFDNLLEWAGY